MASLTYSALLDWSTNAVLTLSSRPAAIGFLQECTVDARQVAAVNVPNYNDSFFLKSVDAESYPNWTWDTKSRIFNKTRPDVVTDSLKARSQLANAKLAVIIIIINNINRARMKVRTGIDFQEAVYFEKVRQAEKVRDSGYSEEILLQCPYVLQYADYADISTQQAVEDILLKAKFDVEILAKTELLRLRYFNKVKKAMSLPQLSTIQDEFLRECNINAMV